MVVKKKTEKIEKEEKKSKIKPPKVTTAKTAKAAKPIKAVKEAKASKPVKAKLPLKEIKLKATGVKPAKMVKKADSEARPRPIEAKPVPAPKPAPVTKPAAAPKPAAEAKPAVAPKPVMEAKPAVAPKPVVETKPVVQPAAPVMPPITPPEEIPSPKAEIFKVIDVAMPITVKDFAAKIMMKPSELIKLLMDRKIFATLNQFLSEPLVKEIAKEHGFEVRQPSVMEEELLKEHHDKTADDKTNWVLRPPVVTFMGHVDHGKTSLLDYIRKTKVAEREHGGITQHIGAYEVIFDKGRVTFLDTPGHEAFTAMRARGAKATDVVVLVVAANDGIMPQTIEAINHAKAANVALVVAANKCDLPSADVDKLKKQLMQYGLTPEDWGGKTIVVSVSAKTGQGVGELLEMLLLEAELLELKANPNLKARGVVIEGHLSKGRGPVASVLVKNGTLRVGDVILSGLYYGKIKGMLDANGRRVQEAPPSKPVEIMGLSGVPQAGDEFFVVKDEKKAKTLSSLKQDQKRADRIAGAQKRVTLEDLYTQAKEGKIKELKIILKADVQGSLEALTKSLEGLSTEQIQLTIIHSAVGNVTDSDVILAAASNAVVIGFNVRKEEKASETAFKENVEIKIYNIIYEAIADVRAGMEGLLEPIAKEVFMGRAVVKQVFRVTKAGTIAGCLVQKGVITRQAKIRLVRDKQVVYEGKIHSLKRFKDDVREVAENFECGIGLAGHDDIKVGDLIEAYMVQLVARRL